MKKTMNEIVSKDILSTQSCLQSMKVVDAETLKLPPQQFEQVKGMVLLTMKQTAAVINVTPQYIYKMIAEGKFPAPVKLGRMTRFRLVDLEQYLESCPVGL